MSEKRQRNKLLSVRFNEAEWLSLKTRADFAGLSLGGLTRSLALNTPPPRQSRRPPADKTQLALLLSHVGKIGGHTNQLSAWANLGGWPEAREIKRGMDDIRWMRNTLVNALGIGSSQPDTGAEDREPLS